MYKKPNLKLLFKYAWILYFIPLILLVMDYFLYWELHSLPNEDIYTAVYERVQWIVVVGTILCVSLVAIVIIYCLQKANELKQLQHSDELMRRFFVPINGMIALSGILGSNAALSPQHRKMARTIKDSGNRMKRFLRDMDDYSQLCKGQVTLSAHSYELHKIVTSVVEHLEPSTFNKDIKIVSKVSDDMTVNVDSERIQDVVNNIIVAMINYTKKGTITVTAKNKGPYAEVRIEDDGIALSRRTYRKLFKPVYGANNISNGQYSGTGFTLAIAKKLVMLHRGKIWAEKLNGDKAIILFTVPRDDFVMRIPVKKNKKLNYLRDMGMRVSLNIDDYHDKKILLLKQESTHKNMLLYLLQQASFTVDAPNADSFDYDNYNLNKNYDLVLIDELFEDMSFKICERIRQKYNFVQLPILMILPNDRQANLERAYHVGANDCIDYLVMPQQLIAKVKTLIQVKTSSEEALLSQAQMLQSQIQPHFLYNALNVITQLCLDDPQRAHDTLLDFSQCLRSKFHYWRADHAITVAEEIEIIESYLRVEQARFAERLQYNITVDENVRECMLPALIIEPLVENAVKHGVSKSEKGGEVSLYVHLQDEFIVASVTDNGSGIPNTKITAITSGNLAELGTGIGNTIRRLKLYDSKQIEINSTLGKGTQVTIFVPINWDKQFREEGIA